MKRILSAQQLTELADELGVRREWHEPDEQGVSARVEGAGLDNAGFWPAGATRVPPESVEMYVVITKDGKDVAAVNLASLLGMASYPDYWRQRL